jgi:hypothetical protein
MSNAREKRDLKLVLTRSAKLGGAWEFRGAASLDELSPERGCRMAFRADCIGIACLKLTLEGGTAKRIFL